MEPFKILTDGGDDGSGEEEGAGLVPVAGIVGRVFERTHARAHGIDGVLQKSEGGVKVRKITTTPTTTATDHHASHQRRDSRSRSRAISADGQRGQRTCAAGSAARVSTLTGLTCVRHANCCLLRECEREPPLATDCVTLPGCDYLQINPGRSRYT